MSETNGFIPWPLDFKLLELLPDKGLIGGVHWKGRLAKDLREAVGSELVSSGQVAGRLKELKKRGFVMFYPGGGGGGSSSKTVWARTDAGREFLKKKEEYLG